MLLFRLIILVPLVQVAPFIMPSLSDLWKLAKFGYQVGSKIKAGYDIYEKLTEEPDERLDKILAQVAEISNKIDGFESRLDQRLDAIVESLVSRITLIQKLDTTFMELHKIIVSIDHMWDNYLKYSKNRKNFNDGTLKDFIRTTTGEQALGLQTLLSQMHRLIVPLRTSHIRDSLFLTMLKNERENEMLSCDEGNSHEQVIYQIYYTVALTELRGFIMAAWAYGLRPIFDKGTYSAEVSQIEAGFTMRTRDFLLATKEAMRLASNSIRRCDPKGGFRKGISYVEFDEVFQTYVINEADMSPTSSCKSTCATIGTQTYQRKMDSYLNYNYDRPCFGSITGCRKGGGKMTICDTRNSSNSRRYHWFKEGNGDVAGDDTAGCPGQLNYPKSWNRGFYSCDYCVCTCDGDRPFSHAKRALSFMAAHSNFHWGMVVTGIRIVQKGKMIYLQIREGKLEGQGGIAKGSDKWVPFIEYTYERTGQGRFTKSWGLHTINLKPGLNFEFIRRDQRIMNLDDVSAPVGHVVVGAQFTHAEAVTKTKDNPIRLMIMVVPYNFETGKLDVSLHKPPKWIGVDNLKRAELKFDHPDIPTKHQQNIPSTQSNLFLKFQESDLKKDAGQSTIPFWDIQEVVTMPSGPLTGIGIFHKGHRDRIYGGYLAFRLLSLNFIDYLNATVPDDLKKSYQDIYKVPPYAPTGKL
uniref:MPN_138_1 protein n=1 Tax=Fopius arisanus TaxID=64838 RepID=A0A0C9RN92_9HYME